SMPRFREVNRDVDFTKDEAYFITERDDMPTLVDVETDENILRYDMPVVMMAACFSPDDRTLYIAGEDNQLYVFDSGLQASAAENWPLYH
ncbi:MAG: hypothetical protein JXR73_14530, partial [Candidatus Omnitrophica bacterium]|nr:hypothetical protein [Candidatus Omnitrophota bacterium]